MNHTTTIGIAAIIALSVVFTPGIYAVSVAYAGGRHGDGDGDSISIKSKFKQKNICWAVDDSRTTCRNDASVFGSNEENQGGGVTPPTSKTCEQCFISLLSESQINTVVLDLQATSLPDLCAMLEQNSIPLEAFQSALGDADVSESIATELLACLRDVGIVFQIRT